MQSMRHNVGRWMREAQLHKYATTDSMQYCAHRGMAVRNSRGRVKDDAVASATAEAPELRATMRKLAFLVHPDRFAGMPDAAKENEASLAFLQVVMNSAHTSPGKNLCTCPLCYLCPAYSSCMQGLLSTVQKDKENHPPAGRLSFFFVTSTSRCCDGCPLYIRILTLLFMW